MNRKETNIFFFDFSIFSFFHTIEANNNKNVTGTVKREQLDIKEDGNIRKDWHHKKNSRDTPNPTISGYCGKYSHQTQPT